MTAHRLKKTKNATVVINANADILFMPGGDVHGWMRKFANRTKKFTAAAAPSNSRPRWAHYGKPLKETIESLPPKPRKVRGGMRLYASVGSTAPYALYVERGTGIFGGRGPYEAKILPPWQRQSPSLYEHTWQVPAGSSRDNYGNSWTDWQQVGTVMIKGQKPQKFMEKGLNRAFEFMMRSSAQTVSRGTPKIGKALASWPADLSDFRPGNTPANGAFIAQLQEWREWRDEAFSAGRVLGRGYTGFRERREREAVHRDIRRASRLAQSAQTRRAKAAARMRKWRRQNPDRVEEYNKSRRKTIQKPRTLTSAERTKREREAILNNEVRALKRALAKQYPGAQFGLPQRARQDGVYYWFITVTVRGRTQRVKVRSGLQT